MWPIEHSSSFHREDSFGSDYCRLKPRSSDLATTSLHSCLTFCNPDKLPDIFQARTITVEDVLTKLTLNDREQTELEVQNKESKHDL